jgi:hypothetical protein
MVGSDGEMGAGAVGAGDKLELERIDGRGRTMLTDELERVGVPLQVEVRVGPCPEVPRATQSLSRMAGAVLADMVDQEYGEVEGALELGQTGEQA